MAETASDIVLAPFEESYWITLLLNCCTAGNMSAEASLVLLDDRRGAWAFFNGVRRVHLQCCSRASLRAAYCSLETSYSGTLAHLSTARACIWRWQQSSRWEFLRCPANRAIIYYEVYAGTPLILAEESVG